MESASGEFLRIFSGSVKDHLQADVPVGSCLSGGLDSSSIVCVANDILRREKKEDTQRTFSVCSDVKRFDEREFIDEVVTARKITAEYTCPSSPHLFEVLDDIIWHQDEPFGSTSIFAQWLVFGLSAENGIKVMLDGQGADEQLCGYHIFFQYRFLELLKTGRWLTLLEEIRTVKKLHGYSPFDAHAIVRYIRPQTYLPEAIKNAVKKVFFKNPKRPWINREHLGDCTERTFYAESGFTGYQQIFLPPGFLYQPSPSAPMGRS